MDSQNRSTNARLLSSRVRSRSFEDLQNSTSRGLFLFNTNNNKEEQPLNETENENEAKNPPLSPTSFKEKMEHFKKMLLKTSNP